MLDSESQTLKDILLAENLITEEHMKEVEEEHERNGKSIREVIIDFGLLTENDMLEAIGRSLGLEVRFVAIEEDPPREVIKMIDGDTARMLGVVPIAFDGTTLSIILRDPLNYQVVDEVRFIVGKDVNQIVVPESQVDAAIEKYYPVDVTTTMHDMLAELNLDAGFLEEAAMVHDIGIFMTDADGIHCHGEAPYLCHGYLGAELMRREGYERHARVCERHTGTGLTAENIAERNLPLPHRDFLPETLEEQVICYADKYFSKTHLGEEKSYEKVVASLQKYGEQGVITFRKWRELFE